MSTQPPPDQPKAAFPSPRVFALLLLFVILIAGLVILVDLYSPRDRTPTSPPATMPTTQSAAPPTISIARLHPK